MLKLWSKVRLVSTAHNLYERMQQAIAQGEVLTICNISRVHQKPFITLQDEHGYIVGHTFIDDVEYHEDTEIAYFATFSGE